MNQKRSWEPDRTAWLIKNWTTATKEEILTANPGRTMKACEQKVNKLKKAGVPIPRRVVCSDAGRAYERWATVDASDLIQMWPTATDNEILARFSGKTLEQCSEKICELRKCGIDVPRRNAQSGLNNVSRGTRPNLLRKRSVTAANTSGHKGVVYNAQTNKWRAQITVCHNDYHLGRFECKEDAIAARQLIDARIEPLLRKMAEEATELKSNGVLDQQAYTRHVGEIRKIILDTREEIRQRKYDNK